MEHSLFIHSPLKDIPVASRFGHYDWSCHKHPHADFTWTWFSGWDFPGSRRNRNSELWLFKVKACGFYSSNSSLFPPETRQEHMIVLLVSLRCWMDFFAPSLPFHIGAESYESHMYRMPCPALVARGLIFAPCGQWHQESVDRTLVNPQALTYCSFINNNPCLWCKLSSAF